MSIHGRTFASSFSRRKLVIGTAALSAGAVLARPGLRGTLAQDATPGAATPAAACAEPFDASRLSTVKMVTDGSKISVAIVPKLVHPFFEDTRKGAEEEATKLGVDFQWVAPQTGDAAIQVKMIEDLVSKQVNAIVISPNDPASVIPVINDGLSKGILMMTFDSDSPDSSGRSPA